MKKIDQIKRKRILLGPTIAICDLATKELCFCSYFNHPRGCPRYGKKKNCPPKTPFFPDVFKERVYIAAIIFDFKSYLASKRREHPKWKERALKNSRHWQGHLRSELKKFIEETLKTNNNYGDTVIFNPEAMGVNVTETCKNAGLELEWPPNKRVCQVALIGKKI